MPRPLPIFALLCLLTLHGHAASLPPTDSLPPKRTDSTTIWYYRGDPTLAGRLHPIPLDTGLFGFQRFTPLDRSGNFFETLGNTGLFYRSLPPGIPACGFDYGIHTFDHYLFQSDSARYYRIFKTFTELFYTQGAKKEQSFRAVFSRNLFNGLNLGFDFHVLSAPGAYFRQKSNHVNFLLTAQYTSRDKRYGANANLVFNRLKNYENGGIRYDSLFTENIESNRMVIPVNLQSATNRVRESGFHVIQYFELARPASRTPDSLSTRKTGPDLGRISLSTRYLRQIQNYTDRLADSGFYPSPLLDTIATTDSLTLKSLKTELGWSNPAGTQRALQLYAGIRHLYTEIRLHGRNDFDRQFIPFARAEFTPFGSLRIDASGEYVKGGYNDNDLSLHAGLTVVLGSRERNLGTIRIFAEVDARQPGWFYSRYSGNYQAWDTSWRKQDLITTGATYRFRNVEAGARLIRWNDFIYLDAGSLPRQLEKEFALLSVWLRGNQDIGRFRLSAHLLYQTVQGTNVLRLPTFMANASAYYSQPLFKGAALLQPGLSMLYHTAYYADRYNPSLRSFYLQDEQETGNYPYLDVFINLKVQRARFFFTYTHFNAGWSGHTYYSAPGYPSRDGAFKFGLSWRFHD